MKVVAAALSNLHFDCFSYKIAFLGCYEDCFWLFSIIKMSIILETTDAIRPVKFNVQVFVPDISWIQLVHHAIHD
jgi:hypothetical protein